MIRLFHVCAAAGLALALQPVSPILSIAPAALELRHVTAEAVTYLGRPATRISDAAPVSAGDNGRLAILGGTAMKDGVIEADVTGDTAPNADPLYRGFVGIAFRIAPGDAAFECIYIRPRNGRSDDQLQRNHSTQYISPPAFTWQKLRAETPGKYESYVDLVPGQWIHIKIVVAGTTARLYVNRAEQPALVVSDLKLSPASGAVALWIGVGTIAHFANVSISH